MKTINNNKTMNAPQVLSENEMQNVSGGVGTRTWMRRCRKKNLFKGMIETGFDFLF